MIEVTMRGQTFAEILAECQALAALTVSNTGTQVGCIDSNQQSFNLSDSPSDKAHMVDSRGNVVKTFDMKANPEEVAQVYEDAKEEITKKKTRKKRTKKAASAPAETKAAEPVEISTPDTDVSPEITHPSPGTPSAVVMKDDVMVTKEQVHAALQAVVARDGLASARLLLEGFGVQGLTALYEKPECWIEFVEKCGV